jgi:hypothetical protein
LLSVNASFNSGAAESDDLLHWTKVTGPLKRGAVLGPSYTDEDAFDALCTGIGDVTVSADGSSFEMFYFAGGNDRTKTYVHAGTTTLECL